MIEMTLGEATSFQHGVALGLGNTGDHHPERLATGVGVDHRHPLPVLRWLPVEWGGEVQVKGG